MRIQEDCNWLNKKNAQCKTKRCQNEKHKYEIINE